MSAAQVVEIVQADRTFVDGRFVENTCVAIDDRGRIAAVFDAQHRHKHAPGAPTRRLTGCALLPGFVNAHSHAFQRALRGRGEHFPAGAGSFWSWREAMYALVEELDRPALRRWCEQAFNEMLACGITTAGEFHYLHHDHAAARDFAFDDVVLEVAASAGIRIVLLASYYRTGGIGAPLAGGQRRFATPSVDALLQHVDALARRIDPRTQSLGIAPHSIRAAGAEDLKLLCREAEARGMVVHMHLEEQRREIEECLAAYGCTPMEWVCDNLPVGPRFTAVHATHAPAARLDRFLSTGAGICVCPITEGNLGDGICDLGAMLVHGDVVCVGSDSNVRIDMFEELRWLEFVQRLRNEKRGVCLTAGGEVGPRLLQCATTAGARSLGIDAGAIAAGRLADLAVVDLQHPSLAGCETAAALVLGAGGDCVREVCVGGRWRAAQVG